MCKAGESGLNVRIGDQHFSAEITNNDVSPVMQLILQANRPYALWFITANWKKSFYLSAILTSYVWVPCLICACGKNNQDKPECWICRWHWLNWFGCKCCCHYQPCTHQHQRQVHPEGWAALWICKYSQWDKQIERKRLMTEREEATQSKINNVKF